MDWRRQFDDLGFSFHSDDGGYWDETACYRFSAEEIDDLEAASEELHRMCLAAVGHVISANRFSELAIPETFAAYAAQSWRANEPTLFGRFDFSYDGSSPPKLLEYNADTPTSLIEGAIAQWNWQQALHPGSDQFNSLHEKLIERWRALARQLPGAPVHFSCLCDSQEDVCNLDYLRDTALQAGVDARALFVEDIGWDAARRQFVDLEDAPVGVLVKLYPWEWMIREQFGARLIESGLKLLEPPWKMILSNKGILPILWELFPGHPNLLPAFFEAGRIDGDTVRKPLLSREGANVMIRRKGLIVAEQGSYGAEGYVYQAYSPLPSFAGKHAVVGSWIIGDKAAGIGMRESESLITSNTSRFVPHYFD